jgi:hypothetical protein
VGSALSCTLCGEGCAGPRVAVTLVYGANNDTQIIEVGDIITVASSVTGISCIIIQIVGSWQ